MSWAAVENPGPREELAVFVVDDDDEDAEGTGRAVRGPSCVISANHQVPDTARAQTSACSSDADHVVCPDRRSTIAKKTQPTARTQVTRTRRCLNMRARLPEPSPVHTRPTADRDARHHHTPDQ